METIGDRINLLRDNLEISQVKLAKAVEVTKATMSKYEHNISIPNAETIGKIADILNTTTDYLIGRTKNKAPLIKGNEWVQLSDIDNKLLNLFHLLSTENKARVFERIEILLEERNR